MAGQLDLRAGDADRDGTAERLRTAHTEGRLDLAEFQDRLERAYAARTLGELRALVRDLPGDERRPSARFRRRRRPVVPVLPILIALLVVSAATGHHVFWLWIPLVFFLWRMSWWRVSR